MKFFGWMQNKLNGKQGKQGNKPNTTALSSNHQLIKQEPREEFSDWPHGLLAIGTFGSNSGLNKEEIQEEPPNVHIKKRQDQDQDRIDQSSCSSDDDLEDFTPEEVGKLQKELTKLLTRTKKRKSDFNKELIATANNNLPLDRFLNCPSSLEVDRRISNALCTSTTTAACDDKEEDDNIERTISAILGRCKEISTENKKKKKRDIAKSSVSFLFKKIFVCTNGFNPKPNLRDTLQESRMEKLLRMMLHKKINSQGTSRTPSMKKYLQDKQQISEKSYEEEEEEEEAQEKNSDGYKWVKTDSDFIVLEI